MAFKTPPPSGTSSISEKLPATPSAPPATGLAARLEQLLRGERTELDGLLATVETHTNIPDTRTCVHCHAIRLNGNGIPRVNDLAREAVNHLVDYAIPRSQIALAQAKDTSLNTTRHTTSLRTKAKGLLTDVAQTGEGGELLLYMLVQAVLRLPQLFCKMPLKTHPQVHIHGIDGIHAGLDPSTGQLALYWGESKLHKDVKSALAECLDSLSPFLSTSGGSSARYERDLQLLRDNMDLNDPDLQAAILRYLDIDDPNYNSLHFRGVGLVGFDHESYPAVPNSRTLDEVLADIRLSLEAWKPSVRTHVHNRPPLATITLELFLLPFPSVEDFRQAFLKELRLG
jgi:hypothetical protein